MCVQVLHIAFCFQSLGLMFSYTLFVHMSEHIKYIVIFALKSKFAFLRAVYESESFSI